MNHFFTTRMKTYLAIGAVLFASVGLGAVATREVGIETAQARSLVTQAPAGPGGAQRAQDVVSLERARLLAPRADFVRSALTSRNVGEVATPLERAAGWVTPVEWSYLATAFGWIAGLCLAVAIGRQGKERRARRVALGFGSLLLLSLGGFLESSAAAQGLAVVVHPSGALVAPYDGAGATADLGPGMVVAIVGSRYGEFVQVRGPDGTLGWLKSEALEPVVGTSI